MTPRASATTANTTPAVPGTSATAENTLKRRRSERSAQATAQEPYAGLALRVDRIDKRGAAALPLFTSKKRQPVAKPLQVLRSTIPAALRRQFPNPSRESAAGRLPCRTQSPCAPAA